MEDAGDARGRLSGRLRRSYGTDEKQKKGRGRPENHLRIVAFASRLFEDAARLPEGQMIPDCSGQKPS